MIECFFDDSGKESSASEPFVCMAGYLADIGYWARFVERWQQLRLFHHISGVHMKELIPLQGEYKTLGWTVEKRNAVLSDFIRIIKEERLVGFGVAVEADCWRQLPEPNRKQYGTAQEFCFTRIVHMVVHRLEECGDPDFVSLHFDRDKEFARPRLTLYENLLEHDERVRKRIVELTFANPLFSSPLQAADVLAWETRKELIQKAGGHDSTARFKDLFTALEGVELDYTSELWDRAELERVFQRVGTPNPNA